MRLCECGTPSPAESPLCPRSASASPLAVCSHRPHRCSERWRVTTSTPDITQRPRRRDSTPVGFKTNSTACSLIQCLHIFYNFLGFPDRWLKIRKRRKTRSGRTKRKRAPSPRRQCWKRDSHYLQWQPDVSPGKPHLTITYWCLTWMKF